MASTVEEMTVSIDQIAEHAREAQNISQSSSELSTQGSDVILKVVGDMRGIAETVHESSAIIEGLGRQSDEIYSIIQAIKEIADQTNLLALNAAIEAARAGEQGRGFAVVADEVRKLAERTTGSTEKIAAMIQKIQVGTKQAVASMEVGVERVNQGVSLAGQAGEAIRQIQAGAQRVGVAVTDISSALREQSIASSEIARHVEQVAQMSDENHAAIQHNAESALRLEELAMSLEGAVEKFKV
jgi:methyl-accepting chemotaxis protein